MKCESNMMNSIASNLLRYRWLLMRTPSFLNVCRSKGDSRPSESSLIRHFHLPDKNLIFYQTEVMAEW